MRGWFGACGGCHCKATLWKLDPETGDVIWSADRKNTSASIYVSEESGDLYVYETGTASPASLVKRRDNGSDHTKIWSVANGYGDIEKSTSDGVLWGGTSGTLKRISLSDGSVLTSGSSAAGGPYLAEAGSNSMFMVTSTGFPSGGSLNLYDNAVSLTTSLPGVREGLKAMLADYESTDSTAIA